MQRVLSVLLLSSVPACVSFDDNSSPQQPPPGEGERGVLPLAFSGVQPVNGDFPDQFNLNLHVAVGAPGLELPPLHPAAVRVDDPTELDQGGPLVGLFTGLGVLAAHHTDIAFLGACDNLFVTADYLRLLFATLRDEPGLGGILPGAAPASGEATDRHFPHPLASAVRVAPAHAAARDVLAKGGRRPLFMFDRIGARWLDATGLPDRDVLRTCNTPQEYAEALALDAARGLPGAGA